MSDDFVFVVQNEKNRLTQIKINLLRFFSEKILTKCAENVRSQKLK